MAILEDDVDLDRDRTLVARFQAGDTDAFDDLYVRYFARLARFCRRRVEDSHEAEEVAQEAFVRAYRALPRLGGDQRFYPWLTVIASRVAIDAHRRNARAARAPMVVDIGVDGGQEIVFHQADVSNLRTAMDRLRPRYRDVLDLREGQGWSYKRIAEHQGVSVGTVQLLIFRARAALRREFHAIAGSDARLAGLGAIGALIRAAARGAQRTQSRAAVAIDAVASLALQPVAAVLVAVGAIALGGAGASHLPLPAAHEGRVASLATVRASDTTPARAPVGSAAPASTASPTAPLAAPVVLRTTSNQESRAWQRTAPVAVSNGEAATGADPGAVVADSSRAANRYLTQLGVPRATWACVAVTRLDFGACLDDPFPESLPPLP